MGLTIVPGLVPADLYNRELTTAARVLLLGDFVHMDIERVERDFAPGHLVVESASRIACRLTSHFRNSGLGLIAAHGERPGWDENHRGPITAIDELWHG